ncbi:hypothetical protein EDF36_3532 [Rathayibacter sp. PhB152]|uniref:hypothetical protein n=1 Tax=unclassified Rathayibacter TaxID=2609250 RepID=UPI000F4C2AA0|nr:MULTISPECIES: hypothetical protein [unclassified Rathayibacter]ROQ54478.1 hypothetical protein EDF36_3532 [Rathayibacter sp. PhB152]ROS25038.1 hypothetical protein EDF22_2234 [Rathayibacter sp. PhB127]
MKSIRMTLTVAAVCVATLGGAPFAAATAAVEAPAQVQSRGHVELTVKRTTASTITFDVGGGARPVTSKDGRVRITDGSVTSEALPTRIGAGNGRTVSGSWTVDDADTMTFHFKPSEVQRALAGGAVAGTLSSDWTSKEWGHCVAKSGVNAAVLGGLGGAITGAGAVVTATGGLIFGILGGALNC